MPTEAEIKGHELLMLLPMWGMDYATAKATIDIMAVTLASMSPAEFKALGGGAHIQVNPNRAERRAHDAGKKPH